MTTDSVNAYESNAERFLKRRSHSIGSQTVKRWAESLESGAHVIEIACGGGLPVTQALIDSNLSVWAIDSSPTLINTFSERFPKVPSQCSTVLESNYFNKTYDAAIAIGLIFLLEPTDQIKMLNRVSSILKPGGRFLFTAPVQTGEWIDTGTGHGCISLGHAAYEAALQDAGFNVNELYEDSGKNRLRLSYL